MLNETATIVSEDFPELTVVLRKPGPKDWAEFEEEFGRGNTEEAMLNLLITIGTVTSTAGAPPLMSGLADEWSNLTALAMAEAAQMAGTWGETMGNATRLDLSAILAAARRVVDNKGDEKPNTPNDLALASLAEQCGRYGFDATLMGATLASHPRRGAFRAYLINDVGVFVFTRPGTSARSAWDRRSAGNHAEASMRLVTTCTAFPTAGDVLAIGSKLPAFITTAAAEIEGMRGDIRVEVKKGPMPSKQPAETPSPAPLA